jgi:hypothetical protein
MSESTPEFEPIPEKPQKRITVLADMHNPAAMAERVEKMQELGGDINVMIGDAFDSEIRSKIIAEFKADNQKALDALSVEEREVYDKLLAATKNRIRSYWLARVQAHPELLQDILIEVDDAYELFVQHFKQLPNGKWLYGNVERSFEQSEVFEHSKIVNEEPEGIEAVKHPEILSEDEHSITVLFPSMPPDEAHAQVVEEFMSDLEQRVTANPELKNLVIIAHENLFYGRPPQQFEQKMAEAGIEKYYIPFYMPNNYRRELLDFIFKVPEGVAVKFVYGHLHDPKEVTQKGMAFKDSADGLGMEWGVNQKDPTTGERRTRTFDMYQLPFQSIHTIDIDDDDVTIRKA